MVKVFVLFFKLPKSVSKVVIQYRVAQMDRRDFKFELSMLKSLDTNIF